MYIALQTDMSIGAIGYLTGTYSHANTRTDQKSSKCNYTAWRWHKIAGLKINICNLADDECNSSTNKTKK